MNKTGNSIQRTKKISNSKRILIVLGLLINTMMAKANNDTIVATQNFGTKVEKSGNVYNVTTDKIQDKNAFNSFDKFHLNENNIANLYFGQKDSKGIDNLFNFVNGKIQVNGTINGIRENKIGGNLYFLSSEGMLVGKTGVINAGSFHTIVPKKDDFNKALESAKQSKVFDGSITVEGKINAVNEIGLYAADIKLTETGVLKTGVTDFHQLVNIKDSNVNAGLSGNLEATKTGTGDIILSAKVEEAGHELETSSVYEGIGRKFKGKIKANIETSGSIEAAGHAKIHAEASNGKLVKKEGEKETYNPNLGLAEVEATVRVNKGKVKGKKVDITAEAKNFYDTPALTKIGKIAFSAGTGSLSPINMDGALGLFKSKASVFIGKEAKIESTEAEANIHSYSGVRALMGASTSPLKLANLYLEKLDGKLPSIGATYISTSSDSNVTVEGEIISKGQANITSKSENTIGASVSSGTIRDSNKVGLAFLMTEGENHSSVKITKEARIKTEENANIKSEAFNSIRGEVKGSLNDNGTSVLAANISKYNSSSKVDIDGEVNAKRKLNAEAHNITKESNLQTVTKMGTSKFMNEVLFESDHTKALMAAIKYRFGGDENVKTKLSDLFSVGASATIAKHGNTADVHVGSSAKLSSGKEGTNINSLNEIQNLRTETASANFATREEEKKKATVNAAIFYGGYQNNASVIIDDNAKVVSEGEINTHSENKIEYKNPSKMAKEVINKLDVLKRAFEKEKQTRDQFNPNDIEAVKKLLNDFSNKLDGNPEIILNGEKMTVTLPDGSLKTGTVPEIAEYVQQEMKKLEDKLPKGFKAFSEGLGGLLKESLDFAGVGNYANFHTYSSGTAKAENETSTAAGAVSWVEMDNHSKVYVGRGAKISAKKDLNVKAINKTETVNLVGKLGISKSSDSATAVGGGLNVQKSNTSAMVETKEKAELSGENINTSAFNNIFHVAASLNAGMGGAAIGANVLVNNFGTAVEDRKDSKGGTEVLKTLDEINKEQDKKIDEATKNILQAAGISTEDTFVKANKGDTPSEGIKAIVKSSDIFGKTVNVTTAEKDNISSTGGVGTGGLASASGTVGVTNIKRNIGVTVENSILKAEEKVNLRADITGNVDVTAYQGSIGALGLGAAYAELNSNGKANISIKNSKLSGQHIDAIIKDKSELKAEAKGLTAGVIAGGAIISKANNESDADIEIEKSIFNEEERTNTKGIGREINVKIEKENRVTADSQGVSVGAVAGAGIIANAKDEGRAKVKVSKNSGKSIFHADNVNTGAEHKMKVTANAKAITGSIAGSVGIAKAEAIVAGKVMVEVEEGNVFRTNRLNVTSKVEGLDADKFTAKSSVVGGNVGGIAGAGVNTATAESNTESVVRLRKQDYENNDYTKKYISEVNAIAYNDTKNEADIESLTVAAGYAQGMNKAVTKSNKLTATTANGGRVYQLRAKALAKNESYGNVKGSGGALVGAETAAVENYMKSITGSSIEGQWEIGDKTEVIAHDNTVVKLNGEGVKGALVGKNGISLKNTLEGDTKAFIDDRSTVTGTGSVDVEAINDIDVDVQGKSAAYGGVGIGDVDVKNVIKKNTAANIGRGAKVETTGKHDYQAFTKGKSSCFRDCRSSRSSWRFQS